MKETSSAKKIRDSIYFITAATCGVGLKLLTTGIFGAGFFTSATGLVAGALTGDFDGGAF